jgi:two-component system chemotaxis response regulator CheB
MNQKKVRVVIVDDSAFMRTAIERMLRSSSSIEIVGTASNGVEAIELVRRLRPNVITMDIEMPVMDGLQALKEIMRMYPTPVLMVSSLSSKGAKITLDALDLGAVDYIPKPGSTLSANILELQAELVSKVLAAVNSRPSHLRLDLGSYKSAPKPATPSTGAAATGASERSRGGGYVSKLVVIGASTGGPPAVQKILTGINPYIDAPIIVAQHMPQTFTNAFATRMNSLCAIRVKEAANGEILQNSVVYVCPGGHTTTVKSTTAGTYAFEVVKQSDEVILSPSIDALFSSVAPLLKGRVTGVILTGMGNDGVVGMQKIRLYNGVTIAQDRMTSVVYGMPRAVAEAGAAALVVPIDDMAYEIELSLKAT